MLTTYYQQLAAKKPGEELTVEELACALYEGTPHLQNLAETLARQHGQADALSFFDMMGDVKKFWIHIAQQLIDHSAHWLPNEGCGCGLDAEETERIKAL